MKRRIVGWLMIIAILLNGFCGTLAEDLEQHREEFVEEANTYEAPSQAVEDIHEAFTIEEEYVLDPASEELDETVSDGTDTSDVEISEEDVSDPDPKTPEVPNDTADEVASDIESIEEEIATESEPEAPAEEEEVPDARIENCYVFIKADAAMRRDDGNGKIQLSRKAVGFAKQERDNYVLVYLYDTDEPHLYRVDRDYVAPLTIDEEFAYCDSIDGDAYYDDLYCLERASFEVINALPEIENKDEDAPNGEEVEDGESDVVAPENSEVIEENADVENAETEPESALEVNPILGQPENYTGSLGGTAVFSVDANAASFRWQRKLLSDGEDGWQDIVDEAGYAYADTASMKVLISEESVKYAYRCRVIPFAVEEAAEEIVLFKAALLSAPVEAEAPAEEIQRAGEAHTYYTSSAMIILAAENAAAQEEHPARIKGVAADASIKITNKTEDFRGGKPIVFVKNWNDNNGDKKNLKPRPVKGDFLQKVTLQYKIGDAADWIPQADDAKFSTKFEEYIYHEETGETTLEVISVDTDFVLYAPLVNDPTAWEGWVYIVQGELPEVITVTKTYTEDVWDEQAFDEEKGTWGKYVERQRQENVDYDIKWRFIENGTFDGYYKTPDDVYSPEYGGMSFTNTAYTHFEATVRWLDNGNAYTTRPDDLSWIVMRYRNDQTPDQAESYTETPDGSPVSVKVIDNRDNTWTVTTSDLIGYAEDNMPYVYYLTPKGIPAGGVSGNEYVPVYDNVDNFASLDNGLYRNGTLTATLTNTTHYEATKEWVDGENPDRPDAELVLYRLIKQDDGNFDFRTAGPVVSFDNKEVPKQDGKILIVVGQDEDSRADELPMYDAHGRKYYYYGREIGVDGDYKIFVDNSGRCDTDAEPDSFTEKGFVMNGGEITNKLDAEMNVGVTKSIVGNSVQSIPGVEARVQLQRWNNDEQKWVDFDDENGHGGELILSGFNHEITSASDRSNSVPKYDDEGYRYYYRYIETGIKPGAGKDFVPIGWENANAAPGSGLTLTYESPDRVNVGEIITAEYGSTTAYFQPMIDVDCNAQHTQVNNVLSAETEIVIEKAWYDENGQQVLEPFDNGRNAVFHITRSEDGASTEYGSLKDHDGNTVLPIEISPKAIGDDGWAIGEALNLDRFDKYGNEYTYIVHEAQDADYICLMQKTWNDVVVRDGIHIKQTWYKEVNIPGVGESLEFFVHKQWFDESDLMSRVPVKAGIFRIDTGEQVGEAFELNESNNWYVHRYVEPYAKEDGTFSTVSDYIVKEINVGGVSVDYDVSDEEVYARADNFSRDYAYGDRVAHVQEADKDDPLNEYWYNVYTEIVDDAPETTDAASDTKGTIDHSNMIVWRITNQRFGTANLNFKKTWIAGSEAPAAVFELRKKVEEEGEIKFVEIGEFTINVNANDPNNIVTSPDAAFRAMIEIIDISRDEISHNTTIEVQLEGLNKYNNDGSMIIYNVQEINVGGVEVTDGGALIPIGETGRTDKYLCGMSQEETVIKGRKYHHNGDVYKWVSTNTRAATLGIKLYKVWYDDGTEKNEYARPDVYFTVKRVSGSAPVPGTEQTLEDYLKAEESPLVIAEKVARVMQETPSKIEAIEPYGLWNTKHNDWMWSCNLGALPRYDGAGYPYIYFIEEYYTGGNNGEYSAAYLNDTWKRNHPEAILYPSNVEDVLKVPANDLDHSNHLNIIADGYHDDQRSNTWYSATTVNYREKTRSVSGNKLWLSPSPWRIPESRLPSLNITLYRTIDRSVLSEATYKHSEIVAAINEGKLTKVEYDLGYDLDDPTKPSMQNPTELNSQKGYDFRFGYDKDGASYTLPKYDEHGRKYYYYVKEDLKLDDAAKAYYPDDDIIYSAMDFTVTNNYKVVAPYVKVTATKIWESAFEDKPVAQLMPVTFTLYAKMTEVKDGELTPILHDIKMGQVVIYPPEDPEKNSQSYTFKFYTGESIITVDNNGNTIGEPEDDASKYLPYYAPNGNPFAYYLVEEPLTDGYRLVGDDRLKIELDTDPEDGEYRIGSGSFTNKYYGELTDYTVKKIWKDGNEQLLDEDIIDTYHPTEITVELWRKWNGGDEQVKINDEGKSQRIILNKSNGWEYEIKDLPKYAPNSKPYTYYVANEQCSDSTKQLLLEKLYQLGTPAAGIRFANTLKTITIKGEKIWKDANGKISLDDLKIMHKWHALPEKISFVLARKTENESEYSFVRAKEPVVKGTSIKTPNNEAVFGRTVDFNKDTLSFEDLHPAFLWKGLPQYDKGGNEYIYRVFEAVWERDTTAQSGWSWRVFGNSDSYIVNDLYAPIKISYAEEGYDIVNTVDLATVKLRKAWDDGQNYDDTRPQTIRLRLSNTESIPNTVSETYTLGRDYRTDATANVYQTSAIRVPKPAGNINDTYVVAEIIKNPETHEWYEMISGEEYEFDNGKSENDKYIHTNSGTWSTDDGIYYQVTNTLTDHDRKKISITATKKFSGDTEWKSITRPVVVFELQYSMNGTQWNSFTDGDTTAESYYGNFGLTSFADVKKTVVFAEGADEASVKWEGVFRYKKADVGGAAEKIRYRVVEHLMKRDSAGDEITGATSYAPAKPVEVEPDKTLTEYAGTITNELQTTGFMFQKNWKDKMGNDLSPEDEDEDVEVLVERGLLPNVVHFTLYYSLNDGETWKVCPLYNGVQNHYTFNTVSICAPTYWSGSDEKFLPKYDANGKEILYQVQEDWISYDGGETHKDLTYHNGKNPTASGFKIVSDLQNFSIQAVGQVVDSAATCATNNIPLGKLIVTKTWNDENNRDGKRELTLCLYRDGGDSPIVTVKIDGDGKIKKPEPKFVEVTEIQKGKWVVKFTNLPVYKNGEDVKSEYTVEEAALPGYTKIEQIYNKVKGQEFATLIDTETGHTGTVDITNVYDRAFTKAEATKITVDNTAAHNLASHYKSAKLRLEYSLDEGTVKQWNTVEKEKEPIPVEKWDGETVYTTSSVDQTITETTVRDDSGNLTWTKASWENLPVYAKHGKNIYYRVVELPLTEGTEDKVGFVPEYEPAWRMASETLNDDQSDFLKFSVKNNVVPTKLVVKKSWVNVDERIGYPESITVAVQYSRDSGKNWIHLKNLNLTANGGWRAAVENLPTYDDSYNKYIYRAVETEMTFAGNKVSVVDNECGNYTVTERTTETDNYFNTNITNEFTERGSIRFTKTWLDEDNRENLRKEFDIIIYRDGAEYTRTTVKLAGGVWSAFVDNLPVYKNGYPRAEGNESIYKFVEDPCTGYANILIDPKSVNVVKNATVTVNFTNVHVPQRKAITAEKVWIDYDYTDQLRPESVELKLQYYDEEHKSWLDVKKGVLDENKLYPDNGIYTTDVVTQTLSEDNACHATWNNVPVHRNGQNNTVEYRVVEVENGNVIPAGKTCLNNRYIVNYSQSDEHFIVTNTLNTCAISVEKAWEDSENALATRPASITVVIRRRVGDGEWQNTDPIKKLTLNADNKWFGRVDKLPNYDKNGNPYAYQAVETELTYVDGAKTTVTPVTNGKSGNYIVTRSSTTNTGEDMQKNYVTSIINTLQVGELTVTKSWTDGKDRDDMRPDNVKLQLYRDDDKYGAVVELNAGNNWSHTFNNLPLYQSGTLEKSVYRVGEVVPSGYTVAYEPASVTFAYNDKQEFIVVTNIKQPLLMNVQAAKAWAASDNIELHPDSITFVLEYSLDGVTWRKPTALAKDARPEPAADAGYVVYSDQPSEQTITKRADGTYPTAEWTNLNAYALNADKVSTKVQYRVTEKAIANYTAQYEPASVSYTDDRKLIEVKNTLHPTQLDVTKTWADSEDTALRPDAIVFQLQRRTMGATLWMPVEADYGVLELTAADKTSEYVWKGVFKNLPKYADAAETAEYEYRAVETKLVYGKREIAVFDKYVQDVKEISAGSYIASGATNVKNTLQVGKLTVTKNWADGKDRDGMRPSDIALQLYRDNAAYGNAVALNAENDREYTFDNLPLYQSGTLEKSVYRVEEVVPNGYDVTYDPAVGITFETSGEQKRIAVTNAKDPILLDVEAKKVWNEPDNIELHPDSITFVLEYSLDGATWRKPTALAKDARPEPAADAGYVVYSDQPSEQTITKRVDGTYTSAKWTNLNAYALNADNVSTKVQYRVTEKAIANYTAQYEPASVSYTDDRKLIEVKNTLHPTKLDVTKTWADSEDTTLRPNAVVFQLQRRTNENEPWAAVNANYGVLTLSEVGQVSGTEWSGTFENLPVYADVEKQQKYEYRAVETKLVYDGLEIPVFDKNVQEVKETLAGAYKANGATNITNTLPLGALTVTKNWADGKDRDGVRPTEIALQLYRDGHAYGEPVTVKATEGWIYTFQNLPVYKTIEQVKSIYKVEEIEYGQDVGYSKVDSVEVELNDGETASCTVANTRTPQTISLTATKTWDDFNNRYGLRPYRVDFTLQASTKVDPNPAVDSDWETVITIVDKAPTADADDGTKVYLPDNQNLTQTLTIKDAIDNNRWGTAVWNDLSAYVLVDGESRKVSYRVKETIIESAPSYTGTIDRIVSVDTLEADRSINTTNTLTGATKFSVEKVFKNIAEDSEAYPVAVIVQLQYNDGENWQDVPENGIAKLNAENGWKADFDNLRNDYAYRCIETAICYGEDVVLEVPRMAEESGNFRISYDNETAPGCTIITNEAITIDLKVIKFWSDLNNRYGYRPKNLTLTISNQNGELAVQPVWTWSKSGKIWNATASGLYPFVPGTLTPAQYSVTEGKVSYYKAVSSTVSFENGEAKLVNKLVKRVNPKTGDDIMLWSAVGAVGLIGLVLMMFLRRKKKNNE